MTNTDPLDGMHLILGGARSGKSRFAENIINQAGGGIYIATGRAWDDEMVNRIDLHKQSRGELWQTIEEPLDLCAALATCNKAGAKPVLVDCLTLWVTNLMLEDRDIALETDRLCEMLPTLDIPVLLVSNEVGFGIVPENAMARAFRDHAGRLHQRIAELADRVTLVVAGIPMSVK
ncbi:MULTISPECIES: bifunctional adenosylcobinamide kinase/adenosylcobinamide-phosphate guanylyltransferase [Thalassospira]|uniref:Bifunctional adenosylcobalamin biosynthesis protein n=2 Tax=Thalassospira TaxID=168934 RepID=A0A367WE83_9PROT|nr:MULTISPECIES: bifunctional adenosylcobinamide kinase/adenosylcobinamide-phosphate guanylyltransferase [Thalassospira]MDG4718759.1 bifunctional adenosylcobinamide kinase/adenosylcobinamide-phosphate guanylyltransferase [Thalassospira sp. FZY0004]RCK39738.1 adenosylcobinamide kinase [Thalassospira profundimaris]